LSGIQWFPAPIVPAAPSGSFQFVMWLTNL